MKVLRTILSLVLASGLGSSQNFSACEWQLTEQNGVITSPHYPSVYPNSAFCSWSITAKENETIDLRFSSFDLEGITSNAQGSDTCPDHVRIFDGSTLNSPLITVLCRIQTPAQLADVRIRSSRNKMLITFRSDSGGQRPGFVARFWAHECPEFTYGIDKCNMTCNCDKSQTARCNNKNGTCICKKGWGSHDCSQDIDECVNREVEICPHNYQECINTVGSYKCHCKAGLIKNALGECEVNPAARCQPGNACSHMCVKVDSAGQKAKNQCYCPDNMKLEGNTCKACSNVAFGNDCRFTCQCVAKNTRSCDSTTGGCVCSDGWTSTDCSKDIDECTEHIKNVCPGSKDICINMPGGYECKQCSFTLTNASGTIMSPNFPGHAHINSHCTWTITAPGRGAVVSFSLSVLETFCADTYRDYCCNEGLEVYDGDSSSASLIGRYCGHYVNTSSVMSSGNTMRIIFNTRTDIHTRYFSGIYSTKEYQVYRHNLTAPSGNIVSPGYPAGLPTNVYATWTITVSPGQTVTLTNFSSYGLTDCQTDFIEIYDGSHAGTNLIDYFCGENLPTVISSTDKSMYIVYNSLKSTTEKGFNGSYVADACKCYTYGTQSCNSPFGPCVCKSGAQGTNCDQDIDECLDNPCSARSSCINTWGSFHCVCWDGSSVNSSEICSDWGQNLTSMRGYIQSQNFPNQYPYFVNYNWNITGQSTTVVSLRFSMFDLEATPKCWSDAVEIYDVSGGSERLIGQYCGQNVPALLRTRGNKMRINFKTDGSPFDLHAGFNASYYSHVCPSFMYGDESCNMICPCNIDNTKSCDNINGVCFCKLGWVGHGCSLDVDECRNPRTCPRNSDCINEAGRYSCECHSGYVMNSKTRQCEESSKCSEAMRKNCSHLCDKDQITGQEKCFCPEDMVLKSDGVTCLASLYPHGFEADDNIIDPKQSSSIGSTLVSEPIQFSSQIPFGKSPQSVAYVLYNGVILFDTHLVVGTPNLKAAHIGSQNLLAPLWSEKNCFGRTEVSYHLYETCESSSLLDSASQKIPSPKRSEVIARAVRDMKKYHKLTHFEISSVLVATWTSHQSARRDRDVRSTFQAILVNCFIPGTNEVLMKDKEESFAIFIYTNSEHACLPGQPFEVGVVTDSGVAKVQYPGKKPSLSTSVGNTGDKGVVSFKVGTSFTASQRCQRYLCKHSDLIDNPYFKSEIEELYKCPCTLDRLGLQWEEITNSELDPKAKCYAISAVAKRKLFERNQRNRLCCYLWTPPSSDSWMEWMKSWQAGSFMSSSHLLISDPWVTPSSFGNTRAYQDALENIKAQQWCCGKSSFNFCSRFRKIFGDNECTLHSTFVHAHALGDPTINTLDKSSYPMNGWGEFIMLDVQKENFTLQARTQRVEVNGILSNGTVFTAFAAQEQDSSRFQVQLAQTNTTMVILADGMDFTNTFYNDPAFIWSTTTISVKRINEHDQIFAAAIFRCGVAIKVHVGASSLTLHLEVHVSLQNKTRGLLGNFNGNASDDFLLPNGTVLPSNITERQILDNFAKQYLVTTSNSVFIYDKGESTDDYQHAEFVPTFLDEVKPEKLAMARAFCGSSYNACVYDYIATNSTDLARDTKIEEEEIGLIQQRLNNTPPTIQRVTGLNNSSYWLVHEGRENVLTVEAHDADGDQVTYLLSENATGVVLSQDGSVTYTPNLQVSVWLGIRARDSRGAYSPLLLVTIVVCPVCSGNGNCSFSDPPVLHQGGQYQILTCHCHHAYTDNTPPTIQRVTGLNNSSYWLVHEGRENVLTVEAHDADGDQVTYLLSENATGVVLSQDGSVTYTPNLQVSVWLGIRARDSRGAYSPLLLVTIVVCPVCSGNGNCSFSDPPVLHQGGQYQILTCHCHHAYTGEHCESELDACELRPCSFRQTCTDLTAAEQGDHSVGYTCGPCPAGTISVNGSCEDVDECLDKAVCDHACINTYGSYICNCKPGFRLNQVGGNKCLDINECEERALVCAHKCTNIMGSYICSCKWGYKLSSDRRTCEMTAAVSTLCQQCQHFCEVMNGQVVCGCNNGYKINGTDATKCEDVDECNGGGNSPCSQNCSNTVGHFQCSCYPSYVLDTDGTTCLACESPYFGDNCTSVCECRGRGTCDKVRGCVCDDHWSGTNCDKDVNECAEANACPNGFVCVNEPGSFSCVCPEGYQLEHGACSDIDECADYINKCDLNIEDCYNNIGNYSCRCKPGFTQNATTGFCEDINECDSHSDGCEHICDNGPGSYMCACHQGYRLAVDRRKCEEYKEVCNMNCSHGCSLVAGSPVCICPRGYRIVGGNVCEDINECLSETDNQCGHKDKCTNTAADYTCSCEPGYRLENDGRTCTACSGGTWGFQCNKSCSCGEGTFHCDPVGGCICKPGSTGEHCTDVIDRCGNGELRCLTNEECVNAGGNSVCQCRPGYVWLYGQCQDENECLNRRRHNCDHICTNTDGSFTCSCYHGYTYNASTNRCHDVNECQQGNLCNHTCVNIDGSYRCSCYSGWSLQADGVTCGYCNQTLTRSTGYLMTANYPEFYASNSYCTWTITTNETEAIIVLRLIDYDVEGCPHDYIQIYDGPNSQAPLLRQICANWQLPVKSTGNAMHIVFKSDYTVNRRGFNGTYVSELPCRHQNCSYSCQVASFNPWTELCLCPEWQKLNKDGVTCVDKNGCGAVITEPTGCIVSDKYPARYPLHFTCNWTILGDQNSLVTLSFSDFALEGSDNCLYDYVKIYDGSSEYAPLLGNFCGEEQPANLTSSANTMYVIFHSDDSVNHSGFKAIYVVHG